MRRIAFMLDYLYAATFQQEVVNGLVSALPEGDIEVYVLLGGGIKSDRYDPFVSVRNTLYELITKEMFDGIVVCTTVQNFLAVRETVEFLGAYAELPVVFFGPGPENFHQVVVDNRGGMYDLVRHFSVDHGYTRIAFVTGIEGRDSNERFDAYKQALRDSGLSYDPALVCKGDFNIMSGVSAVCTLVDERKTGFDAIIAANDMMALGVKSELEKRGYAIPSDVAIAGFDDSMDASCIIPSLTSVRQPYAAMGRKVYETVAELMERRDTERVRYVPAEIVIRQSCGCFSNAGKEANFEYGLAVEADAAAYCAAHEDELYSRIRAIVSPFGMDARSIGIDRITRVILEEAAHGSSGTAYATLHDIVMSSVLRKMRVEAWHEVLNEVRSFLSPVFTTREAIRGAEDFFHKARLVISDIQAIQKNQNLLLSWKQTDQIGVVSEILVGAIETDKLRQAIYATFPLFNIRNFLFAGFSRVTGRTDTARLIALIHDGKALEMTEDIVFKSKDLFPSCVKNFDSRFYFVLPVTYEEKYLGFVIYEKVVSRRAFELYNDRVTPGSFYYEKIEGLQPIYQSLTRELAKSFYICRLIEMRVEAEDSLKTLAANLEHRNRELQDFTHIASHDLQEPLRKIVFFGERLKRSVSGKTTPDESDYLSRMMHAASRMEELIAGLLAYSRVTTMQQPFTSVNLEEIIAETLQDLDARINETNGKVEVLSLPIVFADPLQMRQLFQNLIGNALKYHKAGVPPEVVVSSETDGEYCTVSVTDNGIGFDQKNGERIFGMFQRLVGKSEYGGTGVGLAICKKIVEQHGGTIRAFGEPGKGCRFVIRLKRYR